MIKISILIPVYNTSKYLERCLNSIICQNLNEIEIICVNDGSTDNSLEILKKYKKKDNRIIIIDKKNGGLTSARNAALELAKGEYCLNIDSDDWIEQGYLEEMYERAKKKNVDMLISDIIFDYDYKKKKIIKKDLLLDEDKILTGEEYLKILLSENFNNYTWNKLIKKECYERYKIKYDEKIFVFEDAEIIGKLAIHMKKIGKINKAYYHYIQGENNGSKIIRFKNYLDIERCFRELKKYYIDNNVTPEILELLIFREKYSLFKNLLFTPYIKNEYYEEKLVKALLGMKIMKRYINFIKEKNIRFILKLTKKEKSLKNKIIIFKIIKSLIMLKRKFFKYIKQILLIKRKIKS